MAAPFGISSISEHYNRRLDEAFIGLPRVFHVVDDCLVVLIDALLSFVALGYLGKKTTCYSFDVLANTSLSLIHRKNNKLASSQVPHVSWPTTIPFVALFIVLSFVIVITTRFLFYFRFLSELKPSS